MLQSCFSAVQFTNVNDVVSSLWKGTAQMIMKTMWNLKNQNIMFCVCWWAVCLLLTCKPFLCPNLELGPLDPDWFEALTAQAFTNEGNGNASDQEDLCANQEGHFKTPFDKTAVDSQLFSTPKVFRHRRVVSPETEEPSSTAEQGNVWLKFYLLVMFLCLLI